VPANRQTLGEGASVANIELQLMRADNSGERSNVVGSIRINGSDRSSFVGWVELLSLLEQYLDDHPADITESQHIHEGETT
jgi:hypothetical protein